MRLIHLSALCLFPLGLGLSAACGSSTVQTQASGTTGGGGASTTTTTGTTATTTTTTAGVGGSGGGEGMASNTYPGPFPAPPQVINGAAPSPATVLASPKIVPVVFTDDMDATMVGQIEDFVSRVGATQYWTAATSEYGVGPATGLTPVVVVDPAAATGNTITDAAIQTWLADILDGNDPAWPAPDANTVYALFFPSGVTITTGGGGGAAPRAAWPSAATTTTSPSTPTTGRWMSRTPSSRAARASTCSPASTR